MMCGPFCMRTRCGLLRDHESDRVAHLNHPSGSFVFALHSKVPGVTSHSQDVQIKKRSITPRQRSKPRFASYKFWCAGTDPSENSPFCSNKTSQCDDPTPPPPHSLRSQFPGSAFDVSHFVNRCPCDPSFDI